MRAESGLRKISPGFGARPSGKYTFIVVGYFRILREPVIGRARPSPIGKPFSATSMARSSTCANDIVPHRSSITYHASITPGRDAERRPSLLGIFPPFVLQIPLDRGDPGAVPSALIE